MNSDCHHNKKPSEECDHCNPPIKSFDWLLWGSLFFVSVLYIHHFFVGTAPTHETMGFPSWYLVLSESVFELTNTIWWGILLGIVMLALLARIPREFVVSLLGTHSGFQGIVRATAAGVLLDLCSHGILMVGAKLYERGASIGQVMAFLIASPWNSFSLTLILIALIGFKWTLVYILLSMLIALITGYFFELLVKNQRLPSNPNDIDLPADFKFWPSAKAGIAKTEFSFPFFFDTLLIGIKDSRMVLRWIFFGLLLASLIRALVPDEHFGHYFGPTFIGLTLTVLMATIIEVCSEGSTPIAADLVNRANAPGNGFAFLMTGVSTDYTEIMVLKDTTASWKIALFLPLLTIPQIVLLAILINGIS